MQGRGQKVIEKRIASRNHIVVQLRSRFCRYMHEDAVEVQATITRYTNHDLARCPCITTMTLVAAVRYLVVFGGDS